MLLLHILLLSGTYIQVDDIAGTGFGSERWDASTVVRASGGQGRRPDTVVYDCIVETTRSRLAGGHAASSPRAHRPQHHD